MTARRLLTVAALLLAGGTAPADFRVVNTTEESDISFFYEDGVLSLGLAFEGRDPPEEFAAGEVIQHAQPGAPGLRVTVPGSGFDFLGAAGATAYVMPQRRNPALPYVGVGAEELDPADFLGPLTLRLVGVDGPGDFSVWRSGQGGNPPTVFFSTRRPDLALGVLEADAGGHEHYNFGFTAPGVYGVTMIGTGTLADGTVISTAPTTLFFGAESIAPAPAPPAVGLCLLGGAAAGLARLVRRRLV